MGIKKYKKCHIILPTEIIFENFKNLSLTDDSLTLNILEGLLRPLNENDYMVSEIGTSLCALKWKFK